MKLLNTLENKIDALRLTVQHNGWVPTITVQKMTRYGT